MMLTVPDPDQKLLPDPTRGYTRILPVSIETPVLH